MCHRRYIAELADLLLTPATNATPLDTRAPQVLAGPYQRYEECLKSIGNWADGEWFGSWGTSWHFFLFVEGPVLVHFMSLESLFPRFPKSFFLMAGSLVGKTQE